MSSILVLSKSFEAPGGVVNFIRSVIDHLPAGIRIRHLAIGRESGRENNPLTWLAPVSDNLRLAWQVVRHRPQCVHVNPSFNTPSLLRDGLLLMTLRLLRYRHSLVFFHGWSDATAAKFTSSRVLSGLFRAAFGGARVICVLSSKFKRSLVTMGIPESRVRVLTTMYDPRIFDGLAPGPGDGQTVLFMARLVPEKGALETLEAFAAIACRFPQARLVIAGSGPEEAALRDRAAALRLGDRVRFAGYLHGGDKGQALLDADLFVFPTRYGEGCPVSLLEAMAAGLPLITTRVGGIPDILEDQVNGFLLDDPTAETLADAMTRALADRRWREGCGCRNRRKATAEFTGTTLVQKLVDLYEEAAR